MQRQAASASPSQFDDELSKGPSMQSDCSAPQAAPIDAEVFPGIDGTTVPLFSSSAAFKFIVSNWRAQDKAAAGDRNTLWPELELAAAKTLATRSPRNPDASWCSFMSAKGHTANLRLRQLSLHFYS